MTSNEIFSKLVGYYSDLMIIRKIHWIKRWRIKNAIEDLYLDLASCDFIDTTDTLMNILKGVKDKWPEFNLNDIEDFTLSNDCGMFTVNIKDDDFFDPMHITYDANNRFFTIDIKKNDSWSSFIQISRTTKIPTHMIEEWADIQSMLLCNYYREIIYRIALTLHNSLEQ